MLVYLKSVNLFWPSAATWRHESRSTLAQIIACSLTASNRQMNQCWFLTSGVSWHAPIVQIAPMNFQTPIPHRLLQVRCTLQVVTEWPPPCLPKLLPIGENDNWRKPQMKHVSNFINICPSKPIQVLNQHGIFWRFCLYPWNDTFDIDEKNRC